MSGLKQLAYAAVVGAAAFAVHPTGTDSLCPDSTSEDQNYADTNPARGVSMSAYRADLENRTRAGTLPHPKPASPMPPTSCRLVEPVPKCADERGAAHHVHRHTVVFFENESGFGFYRMLYFKNERGVSVSSRAIDRVELVSLLTKSEPSVYVLDEMATPALARQAQRRPLDEFERLGLVAVRRGEELVWTPEAPTRMFGAIRAGASCLGCHKSAKAGDLLGAFTYYLSTPADRLRGD